MDTRVNVLHDKREVDLVVIVFVWSFRNRKWSKPGSNKVVISSNLVYRWFGSEGDFSLSHGDGRFFFACLFTSPGLASSGFLEGVSGELLVFHNLGRYVIS